MEKQSRLLLLSALNPTCVYLGKYVALDQKSQQRTKKRAQKRKIAQKRTKKERKMTRKNCHPKKCFKREFTKKKELKTLILLKSALKKSEFTQNSA